MWYSELLSHKFGVSQSLLEKITHITLDSRQVREGSLYVAIRGEKVDGHAFISQAKERGAVAAMVAPDYDMEPGIELIRSEDVKETLQKMAKALIALWKPKIIGITGSIGKTSTKEYLATLLAEKYQVYKTPGNYNSQLTLPLTILNADQKYPLLVLEMGMDQPNELDRLIDIAPPDIAILTTLAHVHVEAFGTFERLAHEKFKIFSHPKTKTGFYNLDAPFSDKLKGKVSASLEDPSADYYLESGEENLVFYERGQKLFEFTNPLFDHKSKINLLLSLAVAKSLGVDENLLKSGLKKIQFPEKRMRLVEHNGVLFLDDSYNACVESVENALMTLPSRGGRKIAILGDMIDQGQYSIENHQKIAQLALKHVDILIGFGQDLHVMVPIWKKSSKKWAFFLSYDQLFAYFSKLVRKNDSVVLKGKRGRALERVIDDFTSN